MNSEIPKFHASLAYFDDKVEWQHDGYDMRAVIKPDFTTSPLDYDQPGWCFDTTDPEYGEQNRKIIERWLRDEWFYCTLVVTASKMGLVLGRASLSGIEVNFGKDNDYLSEAADTLQGVAIDEAHAKHHELWADFEKGREA